MLEASNAFRARPPPESMDNWEMQHMQHMQQPDSFRFASTSFMLFSFKVCTSGDGIVLANPSDMRHV